MEILSMEQGTPEWFEARLGSIGGSSIASVVAGGKGKVRKDLMYRLIGELLSGQKYEGYKNSYMERGNELEPLARQLYSEITGHEVEEVGLIRRAPFKHYSPDGLVIYGKWRGLIEIKTAIPSVHVARLDAGKIDPQHVKQIQWGLACGYDWCDFISYCPEIRSRPIWIERAYPDEELIKQLDEGADKFLGEMLAIIERVTE